MDSSHSDWDLASPLRAFAKVVAIAASGSLLVVGTIAAHVLADRYADKGEQETTPWVTIAARTTPCHPLAAKRPKDGPRFLWGGPPSRCAGVKMTWLTEAL
jgi:hypothetical protein